MIFYCFFGTRNSVMPFNSLYFVFFYILFVIIYYSVPHRFRYFLILAGSWLFYSYGNFFNLCYLVLVTFVTYFSLTINSKVITLKAVNKIIPISIILLILLFSKYLNHIVSEDYEWLVSHSYYNYLLQPIGISFYSLQAISLIVDQGNNNYGKFSFIKTSLFLSFFPQSIAGPIHRWNDLAPQFDAIKPFLLSNLIIGVRFIIFGFFLKLILADKIALVIAPVLANYNEFSGFDVLLSALLFSYQIYFDFFGYSLIAIGIGKVLGFDINVNFNYPYKASSFREFWHRWHISLSQWFRDYVYKPLGGRRSQNRVFIFSVLVTFMLSGFWHGITLNFLIWGGVHGILYLAEDTFRKFKRKTLSLFPKNQVLVITQRAFFFLLISFTWLIFRANSLEEFLGQFSKIVTIQEWSLDNLGYYFNKTNLTFFSILIITLLVAKDRIYTFLTKIGVESRRERVEESIILCTCLILILLFGDINQQQFLYFRF